LQGKISDLIKQVQNRSLPESQIPITVNDYSNFLPFLDPNNAASSQNNPLPNLLKATDMNPALSNLFPAYFAGDLSGSQLAQQLFQKYAPSLFKDLSYDLTFKVSKKSESERIVAEQVSQGIAQGLLGNSDKSNVFNDGNTRAPAPGGSDSGSGSSGGMFNSVIQSLMGSTPKSKAGTLDWKERSNEICQQISKRGLEPYDFGCLRDPNDVEPNFSYRGYAKMVCSRLETIYDPGVPQLCGCPPPTWSGWKP